MFVYKYFCQIWPTILHGKRFKISFYRDTLVLCNIAMMISRTLLLLHTNFILLWWRVTSWPGNQFCLDNLHARF